MKDFTKKKEIMNSLKKYQYCFPIPEFISKSFVKVYVFNIQTLPNWYDNSIVFIGDAAHAVSPNAGQGVSMVLKDSLLLAKIIYDVEIFASAFEKFETAGKPRVKKIVKSALISGEEQRVTI